jgi:hypothetical protein
VTEADLLDALRRRYTYTGNGGSGRYAFLTHVRTGAAWDQQEIDALVVALWPSERHDLHAFEVKCSRTDWLREIRPDTSKSERTRLLCDTFTVVAPVGVVRPGELPAGWGHVEAEQKDDSVRLWTRVKARSAEWEPVDQRQMPRGFVAALLRAAGVVPGMRTGLRRRAVARNTGDAPEAVANGK